MSHNPDHFIFNTLNTIDTVIHTLHWMWQRLLHKGSSSSWNKQIPTYWVYSEFNADVLFFNERPVWSSAVGCLEACLFIIIFIHLYSFVVILKCLFILPAIRANNKQVSSLFFICFTCTVSTTLLHLCDQLRLVLFSWCEAVCGQRLYKRMWSCHSKN